MMLIGIVTTSVTSMNMFSDCGSVQSVDCSQGIAFLEEEVKRKSTKEKKTIITQQMGRDDGNDNGRSKGMGTV